MKKTPTLKNTLYMLKQVFRYCPWYVIIAMSCSLLTSVSAIINTYFLKIVVDAITNPDVQSSVLFIVIAFTGINILIRVFIAFLSGYFSPKCLQILHKAMQQEVLHRASQITFEQIESPSYYDKFSIALKQSDSRAAAIINTISSLVTSVFSIGAFTFIISSSNMSLLFYVFLALAITVVLNLLLAKTNHEYVVNSVPVQRKMQYVERVIYLHDFAQELHLNRSFVDVIMQKFQHAVHMALGLIKEYGKKIATLQALSTTVPLILQAISMLYAACGIINGQYTVGEFLLISNSCLNLFNQLNSFSNAFYQLYEHSLYVDNYMEFMKLPTELNICGKLKVPDKVFIKLSGVTYCYKNMSTDILRNINLDIPSGEKIIITGENGAGKSTLLKLLCGLYHPVDGHIFINNIPLFEYDIQQYRQHCCVISQNFSLFAASIAENILMRPIENNADVQKVIFALEQVELYEKVKNLPNGIFSELTREFDDNGAVFSGGEMQRIALARAFAQEYSIIILDEATSKIDSKTEGCIYQRLFQQKEQSTIVIVAHRLGKLAGINTIYQIKNQELMSTQL